MLNKFVVLFSALLICAIADDCEDISEMCIDHEQCCGGCCFEGECIDTYRSCLSAFDVCRDHVCIGEETCVVFVPPECRGCEPLPLCRLL